MKNLKLMMMTLMMCLMTMISFSQTNFQWDKIDSISKSKNEIYSLTKMFISETWKSSKNVIQDDDKESGLIILKGVSTQSFIFMMGEYMYVYNYMITFRMKDNKYRITCDNVYCESAYMNSSGYAGDKIQPFDSDNCSDPNTFLNPYYLPKQKQKIIIMMSELKQELQNIVDSYSIYIKTNNINNNW